MKAFLVSVLSLVLVPSLVAQAAPGTAPAKPAVAPASQPATQPAAPPAKPAAAPAQVGDETPPLSTQGLALPTLKDWGTRTFDYRMKEDETWTSLGKFVMKTEVEGEHITLHDHLDLTYRGKPMVVDTIVSGPLTGCLRPDRIEAEGTTDDGDGKTFKASGTLDATTMKVGKRSKPVPAETVTDVGLFRLVTLLPAREGFSARFDAQIDASEFNVKAGSTIRYAGRSKPPAAKDDRELNCFSVATGASNGHSSAFDTWLQVWIDDKGHLVEALIDGRKLLVAAD